MISFEICEMIKNTCYSPLNNCFCIKLLIAKSKVVNRKRIQRFDSFFIADCHLEQEIEISDVIDTPSGLQKSTAKETISMTEDSPSLSNIKTPSSGGYNIEDFTTRFVAMKAFFMSKNYEQKQEIKSLKQKAC